MSISCNPSDLANAAYCFSSCIPDPLAVRSLLIQQFVPCVPAGGGSPIVGCNAPLAVTGLEVTSSPNNPGSTTITIDWSQPLSIPPVSISGYSIYWGTSSGVYTNSAFSPGTGTSYTITGLLPSTTYFITVVAMHGLCPSPRSSELQATTTAVIPPNGLLNNLVHYYKLDTFIASQVADSIGTLTLSATNGGADMSLNAGGIINSCMACTGVGAVNQLQNSAPTNPDFIATTTVAGSQSYSFWIWIAAAQTAGFPMWFSAWAAAAAGQFCFLFTNANTPTWRMVNSVGGSIDLAWGAAVTTQAWHHIVCGYDAVAGKSFLQVDNGARIFSGALTLRTASNAFDACMFNATGQNNEAAGRLDEAGVWHNRALTTTDVSNLFNGGAGLPLSSFTT